MNVTEIHRQAMELADQAFVAKLNGEAYKFQAFTRQAFALERQAALLLENDFSSEPSRSVLFRSAASLALECGELREAERLIALALAGNPPTEIAAELRDLFEQVNFQRQLISFVPTESQLFMNGEAISIKGELRHADSPKVGDGKIWLVDDSGNKHLVTVPEEMMSGIVKPLWGDTVQVTGVKNGRSIRLAAIQRVEA